MLATHIPTYATDSQLEASGGGHGLEWRARPPPLMRN
jgi:hypothetical protein